MIAWIQGLIGDAANTIAGVANAATARILAVYNLIIGFLARVKAVVVGVRAVVISWVAAHVGQALAVLGTLQWLAFTYLPARLGALRNEIITWAAQQIGQALAVAQSAIAALQTWALGQLVAIAKAINALQGWAITQFSAALARLNRIENYLFGILASPDRIASYIVDPMARALGRWARDHLVELGRLFVRWFTASLTSSLSLVEDVLTRILFE